ncbi:MAG: alpha/beta hydrolase [Treponema sp.]|nr:alpha/beta hydrolase [Treponema sp.]
MKRIIPIVAVALLAVMCGKAPETLPQELKGVWSGEIEKLGLSLTLHLDDRCSVDSPDQGAYGLKAVVKECDGNSVKVSFPEFHASVSLSLQNDTLAGKFSQLGIKSPIIMSRGYLKRNRPQTPCPPFPYQTEEVTFSNGDINLGGTLTIPSGADEAKTAPVVVMVSGSGMQDRDETLMEHKPFAVLADAFAREGIASLRYDDRGCGASGGVFEEATTADFASDAAAAVRYLRERGYVNVGLMGHSEGGSIAFMLAGAETPDSGTPDFIVSLAGMADRGDSTLLRQTAKMMTLQGAPEKLAGFAAKMAVKKIKKTGGVWMDYFYQLDPGPFVSRIQCPVLALNGSLDSQVLPEFNLDKVKALCPQADCRLYPGLNHLFQHCTTGLSLEYAKIEETFSEEVITDIINWIKTGPVK